MFKYVYNSYKNFILAKCLIKIKSKAYLNMLALKTHTIKSIQMLLCTSQWFIEMISSSSGNDAKDVMQQHYWELVNYVDIMYACVILCKK